MPVNAGLHAGAAGRIRSERQFAVRVLRTLRPLQLGGVDRQAAQSRPRRREDGVA